MKLRITKYTQGDHRALTVVGDKSSGVSVPNEFIKPLLLAAGIKRCPACLTFDLKVSKKEFPGSVGLKISQGRFGFHEVRVRLAPRKYTDSQLFCARYMNELLREAGIPWSKLHADAFVFRLFAAIIPEGKGSTDAII